MDYDHFERMLKQKDENVKPPEQAPLERKEKPDRAQAEKSADLRDFIRMVSELISKSTALRELEVEFVPDEGRRLKVSPDEPIDHPYILYKVESRVPKDEYKPRVRDYITENTHKEDEAREGVILGQKFKCEVQFDIIAGEYATADEVMYTFEDVLLRYTYYLKKNGVAELFFQEHETDENLDVYRQYVSIRSIKYYVEVERLTTVFASEIEDITIT